jgi:lipid-binding SYLF domain-containing protein
MNRRAFLLAGAVALAPAVSSVRAAGDDESDEAKRLHDAATIFGEIMSAEDQAIPASILDKAEAIAIFPSTIKAGFIFGGMRGRGVLSARSGRTWSEPTFMTLTGGSFGLQIGGQAADLVLVIMQRRGVETLLKNQFKLGADASVAAGPVGRDAQASTDLQLQAEILSYSRARGLFAGVTVNGSTVRVDGDANQRFYGQRLSATDIVFANKAPSRPPVPEWQQALARYAAK